MNSRKMCLGVVGALALFASAVCAQVPNGAAAVVNGEAIPEKAVLRALKPVPADQQAKARPDVVNFLIDTAMVDQHLAKMKVVAPPNEVEDRLKKVKEELKGNGQDFAKVLQDLMMNEAELKEQIAADLRWEIYVKTQAPDTALADFFGKNKDWFDGSQMRARHILIGVKPDDSAQVRDNAKFKLLTIRKQIEEKVAREMAKLDPKADALVREQSRVNAVNDAFIAETKVSDCPSKQNGGDLGWFPRVGSMVEPFAKAAFALQVGQMSSIVESQYGYHVILATGKNPGKDVKFDDVKDEVREVFSDKLREQLLPELRRNAKIEIR